MATSRTTADSDPHPTSGVAALREFHFEPQPAAQKIISALVREFLTACPPARKLAEAMKHDTATRFADWIDHVRIDADATGHKDLKAALLKAGFSHTPRPGGKDCYVHHGAIFPAVVLARGCGLRVAIKVDSVAEFLQTHRIAAEDQHAIAGEPCSRFRAAMCWGDAQASLWVVERHGYRGFEPTADDPSRLIAALRHLEAFCTRRRDWPSDADGFAATDRLIDASVRDLGRDWACDLFFEAERRYWMSRNYAAQVQHARQRKLGLGWANHDHHTYRSSRQCFKPLIAALEKLGFACRERFYAGAEAGWGAQVLEQHETGITIFADVDMSPEELLGDFPHQGLAARADLGTVGLWCALHGEAFLQAGMHHLECQFDWHALVSQLEHEAHIKTMAPFTTFPYLRQAFTEGERWPVKPERIERLLKAGQINAMQAETFRVEGALGSHLENLERNDGFKGFNQKGVSDIIARTDPRRQKVLSGA